MSINFGLGEDTCAYGIQEARIRWYIVIGSTPTNKLRDIDDFNAFILVIDEKGQLLSSERILSAQLVAISKYDENNMCYITGRIGVDPGSNGTIHRRITLQTDGYNTILKSVLMNAGVLVFALEVKSTRMNSRFLLVS